MTTDEFLYLFELSADGLDEKTTKTELVRCLAPDLILSLLKAGFNMKSKSSTEIVEQLKTSFRDHDAQCLKQERNSLL